MFFLIEIVQLVAYYAMQVFRLTLIRPQNVLFLVDKASL